MKVIRIKKKKPSASTEIAGSLTSSIKYNSLNEGKAIKIKIKAGVIVQTSSINVSSNNKVVELDYTFFAAPSANFTCSLWGIFSISGAPPHLFFPAGSSL